MATRRGCGQVALGALIVLVGCLVCAALAGALILSGEVPVRAPQLTRFEPEPPYAFLPTTPLTLTFDQPMDRASAEASFSLEPAVPGAFRWNEDSSQVTFVPTGSGYEPGTSYTARLAAGAKAGMLPLAVARSHESSFSLPPLLDTSQPPLGEEGLGPYPLLQVDFSYALDCDTTARTFSIAPHADGLLSCDDRTLTFIPTVPLAAETAYTASLAHVFLAGDPTPRPGVRWEFRTAPDLTVEGVTPPAAGPLADLWETFRITFNRPVLPSSVASRFSLLTTDGSPLAGQLAWEQAGAVLVFQPDEPLLPATGYRLLLQAGVQDALGFVLAEPVDLSYGTEPMLGQPIPAPWAQDVALDSTIQVPFTRPMDKASVEAGLLIRSAVAPSEAVEGQVTWEENTLVFTPQRGLAPETVYEVSLSADVRDATGAPLGQARQWTFTTQPFLLEAHVPPAGPLTQLQQPVEFVFALPMDHAAVSAALTISPTTPGDLLWSDDSRTVTFQPDPAWLPGVEYQVALSGTARSADGYQALAQDQAYAFSTAVAEVQFGEGPNVQVLGVEGERALQMLSRGADVADLSLYPITPAQLLDLYRSGPQDPGPAEPQIVEPATLTPTVEWRELLVPLGEPPAGDWRPVEAHLPDTLPPGLYLLTAGPPTAEQDQLLVVLTGHALLLKQALLPKQAVAGSGDRLQAQVVAWDTELGGGTPVVSATVRLYDREGTVLAEGTTDAGGLLTLDLSGAPKPLLALAEKAAGGDEASPDVTVCGLDSGWSEPAGGNTLPPARPLVRTYSYTDRPVYQPAQTVYFKSWLRADDDASYRLPPADLPVTVRLRDARDNIAATQVLTPTEFGTVYGAFQLAEEPMLGTWNLETEVGGDVARVPFRVADPRRVDNPTGQATKNEAQPEETGGEAQQGEAEWRISADRQSYAAGDVAQLAVTSPLSGPALLTFERGEISHVQPITLTSGSNVISVPVRADYAPNIHVTVHQFGPPEPELWVGRSQPEVQLHRAGTELLVPMADRLLTVTLTADQETYDPGDEATFDIQVIDHEGRPVLAEVSLAVVDEALYTQAGDAMADPFDALYGPQPNLVSTFDSMRPARRLFPEEQDVGSPEVEAGTAGGDFLDTAYWAPAVVTDENGEATVTVELPDDVADWRALARAITTDTLVGQATTGPVGACPTSPVGTSPTGPVGACPTGLVISPTITLRPAIPHFAIQGDAITLAATVDNYTGQPVSATVELSVAGLTLLDGAEQIVHVPADGATTVVWPVAAEELPGASPHRSAEAQVAIRVAASRGTRLVGRDAVALSLPVVPLAVPEEATVAGDLAPAWPTATIPISLPADLLPDLSWLEIHLVPSLAGTMAEGLEYLIDYPYGGVEQTMSRVLPRALVMQAFDGLDIEDELLAADLPAVDLGLQQLYAFQHDDGGWGWWYDDKTDVHQTAYVLSGLSMTEQAGFAVDDGVMERAAAALRRLSPTAGPREQAYAAYALALAVQPVSVTLTLTEALGLDPFSQAALALALDTAGGQAIASGSTADLLEGLLDHLRQAAVQADGTVHWEEQGDDLAYSRSVMGSPVPTTAMATTALARLDPGSPLLPGAVRWLMGQRQGQGWGDTQRTSHALLALTAYLLASQERPALEEQAASGASFQVTLNGELWQEGVLDRAEPGQILTLPVTALLPGENDLQLALGEGTQSGPLYYAVTLFAHHAPEDGKIDARRAHERSIGVRREYRLSGSEEPATQFRPGDLVEVQLILDVPAESWYVVVEDRLPAGFEALDECLGATSYVAAGDGEPVTYWQEYGYNRKDVRDDRVTFFFTHLAPGRQVVTYLARATATGRCTALPTQVYPMYEPEVWSRSDSAVSYVEPR